MEFNIVFSEKILPIPKVIFEKMGCNRRDHFSRFKIIRIISRMPRFYVTYVNAHVIERSGHETEENL